MTNLTPSALKSVTIGATSDLFAATHSALCSHSLGQARALLEELAFRSDNVDRLCSARAYRLPEEVIALFQDRIDAVNTRLD